MKINDYELLHLVRSESDEEALNILIKKYQPLIWKYIHQYFFNKNEVDDYLQEGLMVLNHAIHIFDTSKGKTFTRFFELLLKRRFTTLYNKKSKWILHDDLSYIQDVKEIEIYDFDLTFEHELEKTVHQLYFIEKQTLASICQTTNLTKKQIYNAIYRIKKKYNK